MRPIQWRKGVICGRFNDKYLFENLCCRGLLCIPMHTLMHSIQWDAAQHTEKERLLAGVVRSKYLYENLGNRWGTAQMRPVQKRSDFWQVLVLNTD